MISDSLDIWIPDGYLAMPLTDIDRRSSVAESIVGDLPSPAARATGQAVISATALLLTGLANRDARYCGIGRHLSPDGDLVTSTVTVCVIEGERGNPRLVLAHLVESRSEADEQAEVWLSEVDDRPTLFTERVMDLPVPGIPGLPDAGDTAQVYQLEALVPSGDGAAIAAIELSTSFVSDGPQFRRMVMDMARSVAFGPSAETVRPSSLTL